MPPQALGCATVLRPATAPRASLLPLPAPRTAGQLLRAAGGHLVLCRLREVQLHVPEHNGRDRSLSAHRLDLRAHRCGYRLSLSPEWKLSLSPSLPLPQHLAPCMAYGRCSVDYVGAMNGCLLLQQRSRLVLWNRLLTANVSARPR